MADNKSCEGKKTSMSMIDYFNLLDSREDKKIVRTGKDERTGQYYVEYEDGTRKHAIETDNSLGESKSIGTITVDIDCSHAIKGLKAIQREAKKATAALRELEEHKKDKYLVIEIDKLGDVPKVFHEGEEITLMEFINFQWTTRTDKPGNTDVIVDYFERACYGALERRSIREGVSS